MESYFHTAPCIYFSFGTSGLLQEVNETLGTLLKISPADLIGQSVEQIFTLASRIFYQTHLFPMLSMQGHAEEIFLTLQGKNQITIPVLMSVVATKEDQVSYRCAAIAVHHRKKFEDELVAAKKQAERALQENTALAEMTERFRLQTRQLDEQLTKIRQQHEELQQFTKVVTHELQEPLRKISIFSQLLSDASDNPVHPYQIKLAHAAEQMRLVVHGLQQYLWLQEAVVKYTDLDLTILIKQAKKRVDQEQGPGLLHLTIHALSQLQGDAGQIAILFYELLSNAVQFRKEGQPVEVDIASIIVQRNKIRHMPDKYAYENFLKLSIKDNGQGFDPQYKHLVLEMFQRLRYDHGRGMGLALCKRIMNNHHGTIEMDSSPGKGTVVTLHFPT